jgi:branched-chain amino acid transport system ATP-binding protein
MERSHPLLRCESLTKRFGGISASQAIDLDIRSGEVHAIIGPNGAGKSTLVAQLAGEIAPDAGRIFFQGDDITRWPAHQRARRGLVRTFQTTHVLREFSALDNAAIAVQSRLGVTYGFWRPARTNERLRVAAAAVLEQVGLDQRAAVLASELSHGEQRQLEIAMALALHPRVLLLDEPMAGVGRQETRLLVGLLHSLKKSYTIVLIEHDMSAVFALADRITVLVRGEVIASGAPEEIRVSAAVRAAYLGDGRH